MWADSSDTMLTPELPLTLSVCFLFADGAASL